MDAAGRVLAPAGKRHRTAWWLCIRERHRMQTATAQESGGGVHTLRLPAGAMIGRRR